MEAGLLPLLAGEDNRQEMLGLFVSESRKDIDRLSAAVKEKDSREIISILHRNLPLWGDGTSGLSGGGSESAGQIRRGPMGG